MAITATPTHLPPLGAHVRAEVGRELDATLLDLIDLALWGKQLHWAVFGPLFRTLHERLDGHRPTRGATWPTWSRSAPSQSATGPTGKPGLSQKVRSTGKRRMAQSRIAWSFDCSLGVSPKSASGP